MTMNLALLSKEEMEKIYVDLAAASVAFRERYNIPVFIDTIEHQQPTYLRNWFHKRLIIHRLSSLRLSRLPYEPNVK